MEACSTPRVNFEVMQRCQGRRVLLVGEVENLADGQLTLLTSDKGRVNVVCSSRGDPISSKFVEILGTVVDGQTVKEDEHTNFGDNFGAARCGVGGHRVARGRALPPAARPSQMRPTPNALAACTPPLAADMNTYNELIKLQHGRYMDIFA